MSSRWPANVILSPEMAEVLDAQSGTLKSGGRSWKQGDTDTPSWRTMEGRTGPATRSEYNREADEGGASRFFLNAGYEQWEIEWIYSVGLKPCGME